MPSKWGSSTLIRESGGKANEQDFHQNKEFNLTCRGTLTFGHVILLVRKNKFFAHGNKFINWNS